MPASDPRSSEITPESVYLRRREFLSNGVRILGTATAVGAGLTWLLRAAPAPDPPQAPPLDVASTTPAAAAPQYALRAGAQRPFQAVTTYNNFYSSGLDKDEPAQNAHTLHTSPWTIQVMGEVAQPRTIAIEDLLSWFPL